jgi:hypothetical protein
MGVFVVYVLVSGGINLIYDAGPSEWMTTILFGIFAGVIWEFKKDSSERNALEKGIKELESHRTSPEATGRD